MFWLKSCPRCRGDLYEGKDVYGQYLACLQCGHYLTEAEELALRWSAQRDPVARSSESAPAEVWGGQRQWRQGHQLTPLEMGVRST